MSNNVRFRVRCFLFYQKMTYSQKAINIEAWNMKLKQTYRSDGMSVGIPLRDSSRREGTEQGWPFCDRYSRERGTTVARVPDEVCELLRWKKTVQLALVFFFL